MNANTLMTSLLALCLVTVTAPGQARIKCWTNHQGVKECGNAVPPEFAQQGHEVLSKDGITIDEQGRAKTAAELAAEREQERIRQQEADRKAAILAKQHAEDQVLLNTYSSVADMELAREGKITSVEADIKLMQSQIRKQKDNYDEMIAVAAQQERQGRELSEAVRKDISALQNEIANSEAFIAEKRAEQEQIREQYAVDIERFKYLKGLD